MLNGTRDICSYNANDLRARHSSGAIASFLTCIREGRCYLHAGTKDGMDPVVDCSRLHHCSVFSFYCSLFPSSMLIRLNSQR